MPIASLRPLTRAGLILCPVLLTALSTTPAHATSTHSPSVFAAAPAGSSKPDDITMLDGQLYVTYQNNAGPDGSPRGSRSTVVALDHAGHPRTVWSIAGRIDGLTADPARNRVLATANEDVHSSLYVITPEAKNPAHYTYSPDPAQKGGDGTNGGTDSISIASDGTIYLAHSNPDPALPAPNNAPAVYRATLSGSTATLTPVFGVNDTATLINAAAGKPTTVKMALTDPDSNRILTVGGSDTLVQDAQADSKLIFASNLTAAAPTVKELDLHNAAGASTVTPQLDDIAQITGPGTLYIADQGSGIIYALNTASIAPGTIVVSQPKPSTGDMANHAAVGTLDTSTGIVTPLLSALKSPKGLVFVPATAGAGTPTTSSTTTASPPTATSPVTTPAGVTPPVAVDSGRADPGTPQAGLIYTGGALLIIAAAAAAITAKRRTQRR